MALIIVIATIPFYKGWIWLTTMDKRGVMRFYFNHAKDAQWEIPAYDLLRTGLPIGREFAQEHPNYTPDGKGGNTLFLPIPYSDGCKVTFELPDSIEPSPKYYGINYRRYPVAVSYTHLRAPRPY